MSKKQYIKRHILIINKLRKAACNFKDMQDYLKRQSDIEEDRFEVSIRTFQRDLKEIESIYNIEVSFNRATGLYEITEDANEDKNNRLLESFEIFHALNLTDSLHNQIILEKRKPLGTENMYGLLHAIKHTLEVNVLHEKFWDNPTEVKQRQLYPLSLKESQYRWYLVAIDKSDSRMKTFSLDRISEVQITNHKFTPPSSYYPEKFFKYSFGVIDQQGIPEKIVLSFTTEQGKYVKSLPLHHSQKEIYSDVDNYKIELFVHPTYDFIKEVLSFGNNVKVIEPASFQKMIKNQLVAALDQY